jgi:hypothetical protein
MKDKDIFDHFNNRWVSTEDFVEAHNYSRLKDIALSILAVLLMFTCTLVLLCGLIR